MSVAILPPGAYVGERWNPVSGKFTEWELGNSDGLDRAESAWRTWESRVPDPVWCVSGQRPPWARPSKVKTLTQTYGGHSITRYDLEPKVDLSGFWSDGEIDIIAWLLHFRIATTDQMRAVTWRWRDALQSLWNRGAIWNARGDVGVGFPGELTVWRLAAPQRTYQALGVQGHLRCGKVPADTWKGGIYPAHDVTGTEFALRMFEDHHASTGMVAGESLASAAVLLGSNTMMRGDLVWVGADGTRVVVEIQRRGEVHKKVNAWASAMAASDADERPFVLIVLAGQNKNTERYVFERFAKSTDPTKVGLSQSRAARDRIMFVSWESWFPFPGAHTERWATAQVWKLGGNTKWVSQSMFDVSSGEVSAPLIEARNVMALTPDWVPQPTGVRPTRPAQEDAAIQGSDT